MQKKNDFVHINVAELNAVMKSINLAIKSGLQRIEVKTDSATVTLWVRSEIPGERRVKTKRTDEVLVKRRD